ncbi:MAG: HAD family hydrolase [bacterium]
MVSYNPCVCFGTRKSDHPLAGVIFDLGGTLIYPTRGEEACAAHLETWLRSQGWPATVGPAIRESRRWLWEMSRATRRQYTMHDAVRRVARHVARTPDLAFVAAAERVFFEPELEGYLAYPDALPLLRRLRAARVRLACISNASSDWLIEQIVDRMGFRPYLDPVVSSAGFGRVKPEPEIFRLVLNRWGIAPHRTAMVGDTPEADIRGGRGVGMRTIYAALTPNPYNVARRGTGADAEVGTLAEAERVLVQWLREKS